MKPSSCPQGTMTTMRVAPEGGMLDRKWPPFSIREGTHTAPAKKTALYLGRTGYGSAPSRQAGVESSVGSWPATLSMVLPSTQKDACSPYIHLHN